MTAIATSAMPADNTPPMAPSGVSAKAVDSQSRIDIRWDALAFDRDGHREALPLAGYRLFRYDSENAPLATGVQIGGVTPPPMNGETLLTVSDTSPLLRVPFGEKTLGLRNFREVRSGGF